MGHNRRLQTRLYCPMGHDRAKVNADSSYAQIEGGCAVCIALAAKRRRALRTWLQLHPCPAGAISTPPEVHPVL